MLWAQKRLNSDLMNAYIDTHHLRDSSLHVRVYVIDSGFDAAQIPNLAHPETFAEEPGVFGTNQTPGDATIDPKISGDQSLVGDPANDIDGHGTMVVSVIGGKNGIGVAQHTDLSLLRITGNGTGAAAGSTDDTFLDYAMLRACSEGIAADPNGIVIINSSWATRAAEDGMTPLSKSDPTLLTQLAAKGCLVVQAAGNSAFVGPISVNAIDQGPLLSVSATQPFNSFANFSSSGQVAAPGENVYALASHLAPLTSRNDSCETIDQTSPTPHTFISGTSFSSPMTAGIAAEVTGVLRTLHPFAFNALNPADKIHLLIRILEASAPANSAIDSIDGLRAILIAERWQNGVPEITDLRTLLTQTPPSMCANAPTDFDSGRAYFSACRENKSTDELNAVAMNLESTALSAKAYESASGFLASGNADDQTIEKFSESYVSNLTMGSSNDSDLNTADNQLFLQVYMDASFSQFIMPAHLRVTGGKARYLMTGLLSSWSTEAYLERGPNRGSEPILKSLVDNLEHMDPNDVVGALTDFIHFWFTQLNAQTVLYNANDLTTVIRILNEVRARPALASIGRNLDSLEQEILSEMDKMPAMYGKNFDALALYGEVYQDRAYLFQFLDRHAADLAPILQDPHPENYAEIKIEYLAETAGASNLDFLARIGNVLSTASLWKLCASTLSSELGGLLSTQLLAASAPQIQTWMDAVDLSSAQTSLELDNLIYQYASDLDTVKNKQLSAVRQSEILVLETILSKPNALASLPSDGLSSSELGMLKADTEWTLRGVFPSAFLNLLPNVTD